MIEVNVRWFAAYRERTGHESEQIATMQTTPAALFKELADRYQTLGSHSSALVAINGEMADWSSTIRDGDEVLFFPPVAGG